MAPSCHKRHTTRFLIFLWLLVSVSGLEAQSRHEIEIVFAGDAMMHDRQLKAARHPDGTYDFSPYFREIRPYIESADYAVVNLELPLGGPPYSGYPMFCAPDTYIDPLIEAGFDLFLNANNHILDRRDKGLRRTVATLDSRSMSHIGAYPDKACRDSVMPFVADIKGMKVAFLNYTYGTNGIEAQGNIVVDIINRDLIARDIAAARAGGAEIITVCMHWGEEYRLLPSRSELALADFLEQQGVDLIIGGHPHVIQPMKLTYNADHAKNILTCFSLGNFISAMRTTDTRGGALVRVRLSRDAQGKPHIDSASYRMVFVLPPDDDIDNYRLIPAEKTTPGKMEKYRKAFLKNARAIFDKHNINVPHDPLSIEAYALRRNHTRFFIDIFGRCAY